MSFENNKSIVALCAATTLYTIEHPVRYDANVGNVGTDGLRCGHIEATNQTTGLVFIAFDRSVVAPSGNGVQGGVDIAKYARTGPIAATPGDFDACVPSSTGWCALDIMIPASSRFLTIITQNAGAVIINYGKNDS